MIAGYYDAGKEGFTRWHAAAKGVPNATGFMYTTWRQGYDDLEMYGKLMLGKE